jgi:hypothetical protein
MLDKAGRVRAAWSRSFEDAVERITEAGLNAGPDSDPDRRASWISFELSQPHDLIRAAAEARGWDK